MCAVLGDPGREGQSAWVLHLWQHHPLCCSCSKRKLLRHHVVSARIKGEENRLQEGLNLSSIVLHFQVLESQLISLFAGWSRAVFI